MYILIYVGFGANVKVFSIGKKSLIAGALRRTATCIVDLHGTDLVVCSYELDGAN